jgi:penicillin-binding protein 1A
MPDSPHQNSVPSSGSLWKLIVLKVSLWTVGILVAIIVCIAMGVGLALAVAYPNLPDVSALRDYRPKLPLRVYSSDGVLMGEFGEERRNLTPLKDIPKVMTDAVLAIEDARFFEHGGVDYIGVLRAAMANFGSGGRGQGASTITMQVARNVYLSNERTYTRKIYEMLLTFKLEHLLTKEQILEIYMNQIYLGNRAYGFSAASETYFGKPLAAVTLGEAAMLAGIPKFPSSANPVANYARAKKRQLYIIERMQEVGFITADQAQTASAEDIRIKNGYDGSRFTLNLSPRPCASSSMRSMATRVTHVDSMSTPRSRPPSSMRPTAHCARASWTLSGDRPIGAQRNS